MMIVDLHTVVTIYVLEKNNILWEGKEKFWKKTAITSTNNNDYVGVAHCNNSLSRPKKLGESCVGDEDCWHYRKNGGCSSRICVENLSRFGGQKCSKPSNCISGKCQSGKCTYPELKNTISELYY